MHGAFPLAKPRECSCTKNQWGETQIQTQVRPLTQHSNETKATPPSGMETNGHSHATPTASNHIKPNQHGDMMMTGWQEDKMADMEDGCETKWNMKGMTVNWKDMKWMWNKWMNECGTKWWTNQLTNCTQINMAQKIRLDTFQEQWTYFWNITKP